MNAGTEQQSARGLSASSEARQMMADWLRTTKTSMSMEKQPRQILLERYPVGLISEAELEALLLILNR